MAEREPVIGIDLGTTNSVVATVQHGQAVVIKGRAGQSLTPSVVALASNGRRLVGHIAKRQAITNPTGTIYSSKRLIGRKFSSTQVQEAMKVLGYALACGEHDDIRIRLGDEELTLPEVSAMVLAELRQDAEAFFGRPVKKAVITVPAYFNDGQRQATKDAGRIAGLEVLRIINEPTAAALAYGLGKGLHGKIAVFDLGGGTFDISVLEIGDDVFEVIATGGDTYLGGEDFDVRIIEWLVFGFAKEHGIDLRKDRMALQRLKDAAERAKVELSTVKETQVNLPFICTPAEGGSALHLQRELTRDKLEELTGDLCDRTLALCEQVLGEAGVRPGKLNEVVLVGGMSRMPKVVESARRFFKREPCKGVHPDEVVALGAAVQAHALVAEEAQVLLLDVTSQSLGVAIAGGYVRTLLPKNTTVPASTTQVFHTSKDGQTTVKIMVLQGESELAQKNELLGEFALTGLREAYRGEVEVEVTFDINSEGIVSVSAKDKATGKRQAIVVTASGGLTDAELEEIIEAQADPLSAGRGPEELGARKADLSALVAQVRALLAELPADATAVDVAANARIRLDLAQKALAGEDLSEVAEAGELIGRTLTVLQGVAARVQT